ncbi:SAM-dependent methyltransferase [Nocardia sp. BMG51109]|uniref:SAM-dependent methyltransferase n=1 Tax=Nocardia sp. BMG51109 TaxID=1056816 RepID=UPI0004672C40|nr:SAM-dependent methyltransferase [Nocardia sp. BMG51109]
MATPKLTQILAGASMSALGVAVIRAQETARTDRLYADPYAQVFVDAARSAFLDPAAPAGSADTWERVETLAGRFYEGRTVGVRLADDRVRDWVGAGCRQVVDLGAGLDTRPFRMDLPEEVSWFDIDLPATFEFKEPVLERAGAAPRCGRHVVPADLSGEWANALAEAGFRPEEPTAWLGEGISLSRDSAIALATTITALSAPGSRYALDRLAVAERDMRDLERLVREGRSTPVSARGLPDGERWLAEHGWRTEFRSWDDLVAGLPRRWTTGNPEIGVVLAVRV